MSKRPARKRARGPGARSATGPAPSTGSRPDAAAGQPGAFRPAVVQGRFDPTGWSAERRARQAALDHARGCPDPVLPPPLRPPAEPTTGRQRRDREHQEQAALMYQVRQHEDAYPDLKDLYAVPNGGARSKRTAGRLWAEGVRPGVPDLNLDVPDPAGRYHGFRCEMKAPGSKGRTSPEQRAWITRLRERGYYVVVCDSWKEAWNELVTYLALPEQLRQGIR